MIAAIVVASIVGYLLIGVCVSAGIYAIFEIDVDGGDWFLDWFPAVICVVFWPLAFVCLVVCLLWTVVRPLWRAIAKLLNPAYAAGIKWRKAKR